MVFWYMIYNKHDKKEWMRMTKNIGNTPMIKIQYRYQGKTNFVYTKLEYYNLTGSIKDRVAYYIIQKAKERGTLKEGMTIIEATSGNTGIALAALGAYYKHPVHIFMPDWVSTERVKIMESYNAKITLISREQGGFKRAVQEAKKLAKQTGGFLANQFANEDNILAHYETTAQEIINQLPEEIGGFVSGVGTGGTLIGIGKKLKKQNKEVLITAIEPDSMPMISQNKIISSHKIEGIGDDFVPALVDKSMIDKIFLINDDDAINMSRKLSKQLGLGVGISSGANLLGCILLQQNMKKPAVTVFADDNKKYLSTDLSKPIDTNQNYISNQVELIGYEVV